MFADDPFNRRQPHTCPLEFLLPMQPLKDAEEFVGIAGIKPDTVVLHELGVVVGAGLARDFNPAHFAVCCKFEGVG